MAEDIVESYSSSLQDLTFNSKPLINMLTMLAEDHEQYAPQIVQVIEQHIEQVQTNFLFLMITFTYLFRMENDTLYI